MRNYLLFFFSLIPTFFISQRNLSEADVSHYTSMLKAAEGTYQIQMINTRKEPVFPINIIDKIENIRHQTEEKYFLYEKNIKIIILPKKVINEQDFVKLDKVVHIYNKIVINDEF